MHSDTAQAEQARIDQQKEKRASRKSRSSSADQPATIYSCQSCGKDCHSRIGLYNHERRCSNRTWWWPIHATIVSRDGMGQRRRRHFCNNNRFFGLYTNHPMANLLRTYLTNPSENGRVLVGQTLKLRQVKFPTQCQRYRCLNLYSSRPLVEVAQHQRPHQWDSHLQMWLL